MNVYDAMRTTFAAREFTADPVDEATLYRILDNARFGPSGGNRQGWRVIVIRDPAKRTALIDLIRPTMQRYVAQVMAGENPWNTVAPTKVDAAAIAAALTAIREQLEVVRSLKAQLTSISTATKAVWTGLDTMRSNILTRVTEAEAEIRAQAG